MTNDEMLNIINGMNTFQRSVAIEFIRFLTASSIAGQQQGLNQVLKSGSEPSAIDADTIVDHETMGRPDTAESTQLADTVLSFLDHKLDELASAYEVAKVELAKSMADEFRMKILPQRRPKKVSRKHSKQASRREVESLQMPPFEPNEAKNEDFEQSGVSADQVKEQLLTIQIEMNRLHVRRQSLTFRRTLDGASLAVRNVYANVRACQILMEVADTVYRSIEAELSGTHDIQSLLT